ncbi:CAP domain-containing protein [Nannocystis pusilla]|uniref:CAP domain-containing protein n=1 Tax=Nannocystis pusilla TaxID=889268 RepID=UPI003B7A6CE7
MSEGTWSGAVAGCQAGDTGAPGRDNALRLINLYRWLAGLPAVGHDAGLNAKAQQCALMMHANGQLSHDPPMQWDCYSADGRRRRRTATSRRRRAWSRSTSTWSTPAMRRPSATGGGSSRTGSGRSGSDRRPSTRACG